MQIERNCECEFVTWTLHVWFATHTLQVRNCNIHAFTKTIKCFLTVVVRVLIYLEGAIKEVQGFKLCLYTGFRSYKFAYFFFKSWSQCQTLGSINKNQIKNKTWKYTFQQFNNNNKSFHISKRKFGNSGCVY